MNEFTITTDIDRPANEVFAFVTDFDRFPEWNLTVSQVRKTSEGPLEVGTAYVFVGKQLGRSYEAPSVVTEYVVNQRFATKTTGSPFYIEVSYQLEEQPSGTRLTTTVRGESKSFFKVAEPIVVRITKRQFETAAETLKVMAEAAP